MLLPGTCCHWISFEGVIPKLSENFYVLCVSYDGFDETEHRALGGLCAASLSECDPHFYLCPEKLPGEKGDGDVWGQSGGCEKEHCKIGCRKERIL